MSIMPPFMSAIAAAAYSLWQRRSSGERRAAQGVPKRGRANGRWVSPRARMWEPLVIFVAGSTLRAACGSLGVESAPHWVKARALQ